MRKFIISNIDELDTFESYYGNPIIKEDYITIPYINMGLMKEHPLNPSDQLAHIDFCFLQIIEPKYISVYERGVIKSEIVGDYNFNKSKWFGGFFIGDETVLDAEMEVQASDVYLIIPKNFKISSKMWVPDFKDFKGKGNLKEEDIEKFLRKTSFIKKINIDLGIDSNSYS